MSLFYYPYELTSSKTLNSVSERKTFPGFLIRKDDGFGCVHPWPELGDEPIEEQLKCLRDGSRHTPLITAAMQCAMHDSMARRFGQDLLATVEQPRNHAMVHLGESVPDGFEVVKIKANAETGSEDLKPYAHLRIRLDFNASLVDKEFRALVESWSEDVRKAIDFVEDPIRYDSDRWEALRQDLGLRLAVDRDVEDATQGFDVAVIKPAVCSASNLARMLAGEGKEVVYTSYMDHPLGQCWAAYQAGIEVESLSECGLLTHTFFEPNAFTERLHIDEGRLAFSGGPGLGFGDLLDQLPWMRVD